MKKLCVFVLILTTLICAGAWHDDNDRIRLEHVQAITLYDGKKTTGRRSSPVPQLKCVGGTAGCSAFVPKVVQCKNVGYDGFDVQWECKTDMDDSYRFGKIQVSCEGYDHPNDPYILRGSCGLEYTIDYTEAGRERQSYSGSDRYHNSPYQYRKESGGSWYIFILLVVVIGLVIYKMGQTNNNPNHRATPPPSGQDFGGSDDHRGTSPPPYGFKQDYPRQASAPPPYSESAPRYTSQPHTSHRTGTANDGPGFWSGMGLGGIAGYLFGARNNRRSYYGGYGSGYGTGYGTGYGSGYGGGYSRGFGGGSSWGSSSSSTRSRGSGTSRTTSGFGGTSRR